MRKKKILIIDDEETFAKVIKLNLEETGKYEVRMEDRGSNGLAVSKEFKPDLILLDIIMPDMGGEKVAYQLKNCEITKNIPIVLLSAILTKEETNSHDNILGGYPVLSKPTDIDKLIEVVEKYIK